MENNAIPVELKQLKTILQKYIVPLAIPGTILLLRGQLGAGKTTLVKALMHEIGITSEISSPTFSYVNSYNHATKNLVVHHFDLYRLNSIDEFIMQGFDELLQLSNSIAIVEWPEILITYFEQDSRQHKNIIFLDLEHDFAHPNRRYLSIKIMK